jgi:hypothetical protein
VVPAADLVGTAAVLRWDLTAGQSQAAMPSPDPISGVVLSGVWSPALRSGRLVFSDLEPMNLLK